MEINYAGEAVLWRRADRWSNFYRTVVGTGFGGTRLITSIGHGTFLEVKQNGNLSEWQWNGERLLEFHRGTEWGNVRMIVGLTPFAFLAVRYDGALIWWKWGSGGYFPYKQIGSGWQTARLIAGLGENNGEPIIMEVKTNGLLSQWVWALGRAHEYNKGSGWHTARLLAGLSLGGLYDLDKFIEVKTDGRLAEWHLANTGPSQGIIGSGWNSARLIG